MRAFRILSFACLVIATTFAVERRVLASVECEITNEGNNCYGYSDYFTCMDETEHMSCDTSCFEQGGMKSYTCASFPDVPGWAAICECRVVR